MSHMNCSCCIWMGHVSYVCVMSHVDGSCHTWMGVSTYEGFMSHVNNLEEYTQPTEASNWHCFILYLSIKIQHVSEFQECSKIGVCNSVCERAHTYVWHCVFMCVCVCLRVCVCVCVCVCSDKAPTNKICRRAPLPWLWPKAPTNEILSRMREFSFEFKSIKVSHVLLCLLLVPPPLTC